jgi:hypothetical protein
MNKDLHTWTKTYIHEQRLTYINKDLHTWTKTYIHQQRLTYMNKDLHTSTKTYIHEQRLTYINEDFIHEQRLTYMNEDLHTWTKTYIHEQRLTYMNEDLHTWVNTYMHEAFESLFVSKKYLRILHAETARLFKPFKINLRVCAFVYCLVVCLLFYECVCVHIYNSRHVWVSEWVCKYACSDCTLF